MIPWPFSKIFDMFSLRCKYFSFMVSETTHLTHLITFGTSSCRYFFAYHPAIILLQYRRGRFRCHKHAYFKNIASHNVHANVYANTHPKNSFAYHTPRSRTRFYKPSPKKTKSTSLLVASLNNVSTNLKIWFVKLNIRSKYIEWTYYYYYYYYYCNYCYYYYYY